MAWISSQHQKGAWVGLLTKLVGLLTNNRKTYMCWLCCRYDMGSCLPKECDGWKTATWGKDYCVWERNGPTAAK